MKLKWVLVENPVTTPLAEGTQTQAVPAVKPDRFVHVPLSSESLSRAKQASFASLRLLEYSSFSAAPTGLDAIGLPLGVLWVNYSDGNSSNTTHRALILSRIARRHGPAICRVFSQDCIAGSSPARKLSL